MIDFTFSLPLRQFSAILSLGASSLLLGAPASGTAVVATSQPWTDTGLPLTSIPAEEEGKEVPRRILVLYGHASREKPEIFPMDTLCARRFQAALEWMGFECDYHHVQGGVPADLDARLYAGVVFDAACEPVYEDERRWVAWTRKVFLAKQKILFLGGLPYRTSFYATQLGQALGIGGLASPNAVPKEVKILSKDPAMDFEVPVKAKVSGFEHFQAPTEARVFLRLEGTMQNGEKRLYDPIFASAWGGALVGPYMTYAASAEDQFSYVDPFAFLKAVFSEQDFPAPDTTTRCGQRVFFSHIDGDGFETVSTQPAPPGKPPLTCAEVVRDEILTKYPFPITVSVIEAASRAVQEGLDPAKKEAYEALAKGIFQLKNIQSGSHAYSHPFVWIPNDPDSQGAYERPNLQLIPSEKYPKIDVVREVTGSLAYIKQALTGGKAVDAMLWSGNCRPGQAALAAARLAGVESINGGDTIICRRHPAIGGVAPRGIPWGKEFQVFAANQNEYPYTKYWQGPFYGGFSKVTETFEMTEQPRRLKPVNIYFHFYSGRTGDSLGALKHAFTWAEEQPLHALKVTEYAKSVKAARAARVVATKAGHWLLYASPECRTWRLPVKLGVPDISRSRGVLGWNAVGTERYIHTTGGAVTELVLASENSTPAEHLFLSSSTGSLDLRELTPTSAKFFCEDYRPILQQWGGIKPGREVQWRVNGGKYETVIVESSGILRLQLPKDGECEVLVKPLR